MTQPRLSTDKAREHNHLFHRERLHNSQRCTKIGANNKMFCANYPRDIQKVQGCLLCCTTELKWVCIPAQHAMIRQVLLSSAQRCITAPWGKVRRRGTKEKNGRKQWTSVFWTKATLWHHGNQVWVRRRCCRIMRLNSRPLDRQGHGELIPDGVWALWGAAVNPTATVQTGRDSQSIKGATLCIALFKHEYTHSMSLRSQS